MVRIRSRPVKASTRAFRAMRSSSGGGISGKMVEGGGRTDCGVVDGTGLERSDVGALVVCQWR